MFNPIDWFKSSKDETRMQEPTWDPNTVTMTQPTSPNAPTTTNTTVSQQPARQEEMTMQLRGGGGGDVCCGICAGIACLECLDCCC